MELKDRKLLHGWQYAKKFEAGQSRCRIAFLSDFISLADNTVVVDVGCGSALWVDVFYPFKYSYIGLDFSEPFIEIAKNKHVGKVGVDFYCASAQDYFSSNVGVADVVLALDISEHVPDDEWLDILVSMRMGLKKEGRLFLHTPNLNYFVERMKQRNFLLKQFPEHVAVRNLKDNIAILVRAGFSVDSVRYVPHYNFMRYFHFLSKIPYVGSFFAARIFLEASIS